MVSFKTNLINIPIKHETVGAKTIAVVFWKCTKLVTEFRYPNNNNANL